MPCGLAPHRILPRRYVLRAGVQSPLTCRHPKHLRCSCHRQPPPAAVADRPAATHHNTRAAAAPQPRAAASAHAEALRRQEQEYNDILADILKTIRNFPDAAAAVSAMLDDGPPTSPQPDHPYPDSNHV